MGEIIKFKKVHSNHPRIQQPTLGKLLACQRAKQHSGDSPVTYARLQAKIDQLQEALDAQTH